MSNSHALEMLCEAAHFGDDYENHAKKDETAFAKTVEAFKQADTIIFNSMITNEEAMMLQKLKEKHGYKLINKEAKKFQEFLKNFENVSGKDLYNSDIKTIEACDAAITLGCCVSIDSPIVGSSLKAAYNKKNAYIAYMHPLEDESLKDVVTQSVKYEAGSEEGLVAMLANLVINEEGKQQQKSFFDGLDIGYICGESSVGEEEFDTMHQKLLKHEKGVLIIGSDLYNHPRSKNIAKILGMIGKYSDFEIIMVPPEMNALGVALICDLDEVIKGKTIGYNVKADYTLSAFGNGDLDIPALNQQQGTFTSLEQSVSEVNVPVAYKGYMLNDIANALGINTKDAAEFPAKSEFKDIAFDDSLEDIAEIGEFNGTVIYRCSYPIAQCNKEAQMPQQIKGDLVLLGSKQFATAAKIKAGTMVRFEMDGKTYERKFKVSDDLKGTIAYNPVFDSTDNYDEYRYKRVKLEEVDE